MRRGEGLVGWGVGRRGPHRRAPTGSPTRRSGGASRPGTAVVRDEVGCPAPGWSRFGSFAFADDPGDSVLVVPEVVVGRRDGVTWVDHDRRRGAISAAPDAAPPPTPPAAPAACTFTDGALSGAEWERVVAEAVRRIDAGELEKVVLARDLVADAPSARSTCAGRCAGWPSATRRAGPSTSTACSARPRSCWCAASAAWSPPACSPAPSAAPATTRTTSRSPPPLARSSKDLEEHEYAVRSVADALAPHCTSMNVPEAPFVLHLPNVMHLATDVAGVHRRPTAHLARARRRAAPVRRGRRHPDRRRRSTLITEIEGMDRGRYAGPVGWMDAAGDGEWGIALRSGRARRRPGPAVRRLRHRRRLRPRGRARRGAGQVRAGARRARRPQLTPRWLLGAARVAPGRPEAGVDAAGGDQLVVGA